MFISVYRSIFLSTLEKPWNSPRIFIHIKLLFFSQFFFKMCWDSYNFMILYLLVDKIWVVYRNTSWNQISRFNEFLKRIGIDIFRTILKMYANDSVVILSVNLVHHHIHEQQSPTYTLSANIKFYPFDQIWSNMNWICF